MQYQDLGLTLKIKPNIQKDHDVTLNLDLKITSLQGTSLNNIPVLNNQEYSAIITLHQGASALVVSNLNKQQSRAVTGVPGLNDLPGFQSATNQQTENDFSDLVIDHYAAHRPAGAQTGSRTNVHPARSLVFARTATPATDSLPAPRQS